MLSFQKFLLSKYFSSFVIQEMDEVLDYIKTAENGMTEDLICFKFPHLKKIELANILNDLLQQNLIQIFKDANKIHYKSVYNKTHDYENLILELIGKSTDTGLWLKDIKSKTNIPHNLVLKILKTLEDTRKIKSIKSVKNNRKTYVLYDVKPAEDISGGVWFCNNDVDSVFVSKLMDIIYKFVSRKEEPYLLYKINTLSNIKMVKEFISNSGICEIDLSLEDIRTLIDCLCYDGRIEKIEFEGAIYLRALREEYMKL